MIQIGRTAVKYTIRPFMRGLFIGDELLALYLWCGAICLASNLGFLAFNIQLGARLRYFALRLRGRYIVLWEHDDF